MKFKITTILSTVLLLSISSISAMEDPSAGEKSSSTVHKTLLFATDAEHSQDTVTKPQDMNAMEWLSQLEDARINAHRKNQTGNFEFLTREISATLGGKYGFRSTPATKEEIVKILESVKRTRTYYPDKVDIITDLYFSHDRDACLRTIDRNSYFAEHMGIITAVDAIRNIVVNSPESKPRQIAQYILQNLFDPENYSSSLDDRFQKTVRQVAIETHTPENQATIGRLFDAVSKETFEQHLRTSIDGEAIYHYGSDFMYDGDAIIADLPYAIEVLERSVRLGYADANLSLARAYNDHAADLLNKTYPEKGPDHDEAVEMLKKSILLRLYIVAAKNHSLEWEINNLRNMRDSNMSEEMSLLGSIALKTSSKFRKSVNLGSKIVEKDMGVTAYKLADEIVKEAFSCEAMDKEYYRHMIELSVGLLRVSNTEGYEEAKSQAESLYKIAIVKFLVDDATLNKCRSSEDTSSDALTRKKKSSLSKEDRDDILSGMIILKKPTTDVPSENIDGIIDDYLKNISKKTRSGEDLDTAIKLLETSVEFGYDKAKPALAKTLTTRAMLFVKEKNFEKAIEYLGQSYALEASESMQKMLENLRKKRDEAAAARNRAEHP